MPLPEDKGAEIMMHLESLGGVAPLAIIGSMFKVKAKDLENEGFVLGPASRSGQRCVAVPGSEPPLPPDGIVRDESAASDAKRMRLAEAGKDEPETLTSEQIELISQTLLENNGVMLCDAICSKFKIRRRHLVAAGFAMTPSGPPLPQVSPPGFPEPPPADLP